MIRPGTYTLKVDGSKLVNRDLTFVLVERSNPTPKKPRLYLLQVLPSGSRSYFSSCYPSTAQNTFRLEHGGVRYWLALDGPLATLTTTPPERQNGASVQNPPNNNRILLHYTQQNKGTAIRQRDAE